MTDTSCPDILDPDLVRATLADLHGAFADGYSPQDARDALSRLQDATGVAVVVVWDYQDMWGAGGNSDLYARTPHGLADITHALWAHLIGDASPHTLVHALTVIPPATLLIDSADPALTTAAMAGLHRIDGHNLARRVYTGEAPKVA